MCLIGQAVQASVPIAALNSPGAHSVQTGQGGLTPQSTRPGSLKIASSLIQFDPATTTSSVSSP